MDVKATLEQMQELAEQMRGLHNQMDRHVVAVAKRYIAAYSDEDHGYGYPSDDAHYRWHIDSGGDIDVHWEEFWNYGGHDAGSFTVPSRYVWDEAALAEYEQRRADEKKQKEERIATKKRQEEIEQLKKLQEKYGE